MMRPSKITGTRILANSHAACKVRELIGEAALAGHKRPDAADARRRLRLGPPLASVVDRRPA
jgi:hypothetical protein